MKLCLVIPGMIAGGAQRVMATIANYWADRGWEITLITFDNGESGSFFPLNPAIRRRPLGMLKQSTSLVEAVLGNARRIRTLRREIRRAAPDAVISFLDTTNVATLLATRGLGVPVIVEEHTDPAQKRLAWCWRFARALLYSRAARIVVLSDQARAYFSPALQRRTLIIPNPVVVSPPTYERPPKRAGKTLIALGRLGPEKGFDLLLDAFALVAEAQPDWRLTIWGEGTRRGELETQRNRLGLRERVELPGRTAYPHDELRAADLFVVSSRREGFPMALGEAMACGLAVVSTDCESGPRQIIRDGLDGVLVPPENPKALAAALGRLMSDERERVRLGERAIEVLDRFGIDEVMSRWDVLLHSIGVGSLEPDRNRTIGSPKTAVEPARMDTMETRAATSGARR